MVSLLFRARPLGAPRVAASRGVLLLAPVLRRQRGVVSHLCPCSLHFLVLPAVMEDAKDVEQAKENAKANWMLVEHCLFRVIGADRCRLPQSARRAADVLRLLAAPPLTFSPALRAPESHLREALQRSGGMSDEQYVYLTRIFETTAWVSQQCAAPTPPGGSCGAKQPSLSQLPARSAQTAKPPPRRRRKPLQLNQLAEPFTTISAFDQVVEARCATCPLHARPPHARPPLPAGAPLSLPNRPMKELSSDDCLLFLVLSAAGLLPGGPRPRLQVGRGPQGRPREGVVRPRPFRTCKPVCSLA